ncbi:MAG: SdrD B-like domain-containing protein [Pyrinomonadaceae bacterium]
MTKLRSQLIASFAFVLMAGVANAPAQQAALATNPSGKPFFQSVVLNTGKKQSMEFTVTAVGSVSGRVFSDEELNGVPEIQPHGIRSVKVSLRSRDAGFENFVQEQFTDETGVYEFQYLRPGKYCIEIDPADLPPVFRTVEPIVLEAAPIQAVVPDSPVIPQRGITGVVFVDKNGDGQYRKGKDKPVEGAYIVVDGRFTTSDSNGEYALLDIPAGRKGLVVSWPKRSENTHIVFDLEPGPGANLVVNIPARR